VVAVVGRSNVGKSSLLNRLLGRGAARVGKTPGKTRGIYFYETEDGFRFADFPGAGFARVSQEERERWRELADALLRSGAVTLALRLVDPRVPEASADRKMSEYLGALGVPSLAFFRHLASKLIRQLGRRLARGFVPRSLRLGTNGARGLVSRSGH